MMVQLCSGLLLLSFVVSTKALHSELWEDDEDDIAASLLTQQSPFPISYVNPEDLPNEFFWGDVDGVSYLTKNLNQHIPHYCGSCWAHASMSALADRIKMARGARGFDINLSIQYILNCGNAGSCHGGNMLKAYKFIHNTGYVPYDSCQPYLACSQDSEEGFCPQIDTTCTPMNICRTCMPGDGDKCVEISTFPNATVSEFGRYKHPNVDTVKAEIFERGPVGAAVAGHYLHNYTGGVFSDVDAPRNTTHAVSIVGWGKDDETGQQHWIVRNSWGEYWGNMGFFNILMGQNVLGIESDIVWATPGTFSTTNFPCAEDGSNCRSTKDPNKLTGILPF